MSDETTPGEESTPETEGAAEAPEPSEEKPQAEESAEEKPSIKEGLREGAAKAFGIAVELGSMLSGESGELVEAERDMAAAEAEDFIDRIDGEG